MNSFFPLSVFLTLVHARVALKSYRHFFISLLTSKLWSDVISFAGTPKSPKRKNSRY